MRKRYFAEGRHVKGVEVDDAGRDIGEPEILAARANNRDALGFADLLAEINRRVRHQCAPAIHWGFPAPRK